MSARPAARAALDHAAARYVAGESLDDVTRSLGGGGGDDVARLILARAGVRLRERRSWSPRAA